MCKRAAICYGFTIQLLFFNFLTDYDHLECFVEVGKSTAKDSSEKGMLTNLYDVGKELAPLIFNLPEDTGFDEFHSKCKSVLGALKRCSNLTNNVVIICYVY